MSTVQTGGDTQSSSNQPERRMSLRARLREMSKNMNESEARQQMYRYFETHSAFDYTADFDEVFDVWFRTAYRKPHRGSSSQVVQKLVESGISQVKAKIEAVASYSFLALPMPNGKLLGDCTFAQARDYGGKTLGPFLQRLSKMGKPRQIVKTVLTDEQLFELFRTSGGINNPRK